MADGGVRRAGSGQVARGLCEGLTGMLVGSRLLSHSHIRGEKAGDHVISHLVHRGTPPMQLQMPELCLGEDRTQRAQHRLQVQRL